jgi:hypothetical protein
VIKYRLQCAHAHEFEGWFASSASYEVQEAAGQITCPACNSSDVAKSIMAPNVSVKTRRAVDEIPTRYRNLVHEVHKAVVANSEDVGTRFPEEARKIHYREVEERAIRGVASPEEAEALVDEGIEIMALPRLPEDTN